MKSVYPWGIGTGLATTAYVAAVGAFLVRAEPWFGPMDGAFGPILVLLLLVFSAAVTGTLVFARPAFLALQGARREALWTLSVTLVTLVTAGVLIAIIRLATR